MTHILQQTFEIMTSKFYKKWDSVDATCGLVKTFEEDELTRYGSKIQSNKTRDDDTEISSNATRWPKDFIIRDLMPHKQISVEAIYLPKWRNMWNTGFSRVVLPTHRFQHIWTDDQKSSKDTGLPIPRGLPTKWPPNDQKTSADARWQFNARRR